MANPKGNPQNLRNGGTNKGGPGRPPKEIRLLCAGSFEERIKVAEQIIDDPNSSASDRLRGIDLLGKYGGLSQIDVTSNGETMKAYINIDTEKV